jgi:KDO2-lipid IV(A) lauroyltransferase
MSKKPGLRLRYLGEYLGVRLVELVLWPLPLRAAQWIGRFIGWLSWLVDRRHRAVAEHNAAWALGLEEAEARRFVRKVYLNTGTTSAESVKLPQVLRRKSIRELVRVEGEEHLHGAIAKGRGALLLTAHIGNWEIAGLMIADMVGSLLTVARPMDNPLLEAHLRAIRERLGQSLVDRRGALRHVLRHLRQGGSVAMLIDQNQRHGGVFVDFFGRPASTVPSPAAIALKHDIPVLAGYGHRAEDGSHHVLHVEPPLELIRTGDHEADVVANTALFTSHVEQWVRRHPEQWFWLHSRWRKRPPEEKAAPPMPRAAEAGSAGRPRS